MLRNQYNVGYNPKAQAQDRMPRQVEVKVSRSDVSVRGRKTYIFDPLVKQ